MEEEVELEKGSHVRVVTAESDKDKTDGKLIWVDYPSLPKVLQKGRKIYIDDGLIALKVVELGNVQNILQDCVILFFDYYYYWNCINFIL